MASGVLAHWSCFLGRSQTPFAHAVQLYSALGASVQHEAIKRGFVHMHFLLFNVRTRSFTICHVAPHVILQKLLDVTLFDWKEGHLLDSHLEPPRPHQVYIGPWIRPQGLGSYTVSTNISSPQPMQIPFGLDLSGGSVQAHI